MTPTFCEIEHGSDRYSETLEIRNRILRTPLGLCFEEADIAREAEDFHLVAIAPDTQSIIGCLVLSPVGFEDVQMRQVAVVENRRGQGIGKSLVQFAEKFATSKEFHSMKLHAREPVVEFYESLGYTVCGDPFYEVTLPHREMRKIFA